MVGTGHKRIRVLTALVAVCAAGFPATRWAVAQCSGGNPYCYIPSTVPCNGSGCIPWSQFPAADRPSPTPTCNFMDTVSYVRITTKSGWTTCAVSGDDTASCECFVGDCADVYYFSDDECDFPCISNSGTTIRRHFGGGPDPCS